MQIDQSSRSYTQGPFNHQNQTTPTNMNQASKAEFVQ